MASDTWIQIAVVFCLSCRGSKTIPELELKAGCTSYSIGDVLVKVKNGTKAWHQIEKSKKVEYSPTAPVLEPRIRLGNDTNLNIIWKESYIPSICHCAELPAVQLERLKNDSLQVLIWNLPQFANKIELKINKIEMVDGPLFTDVMAGTRRVNESRTVIVSKPFPPGRYIALVKANCAGDKADIMAVTTDCSLMGTKKSNILAVPFKKPSPGGQVSISLLAGIIALIVASTAVTFIIFCMTKCRRKQTDSLRSPETEVVLLNSNRYSHRLITTMGSQSHSFISIPVKDAFDGNPGKVEKSPDDENKISKSSFEKSRTSHRGHMSLNTAEIKREKMLLYHPDNTQHENKVDELHSVLHAYDICLLTDTTVNWRDFAEAVGKEFTEVVIILSTGLFDLCKAYEDKALGHDNDFDVLRQTRNFEYIPCVAMKKLQTLIQENPDRCPLSVHIVSFERGDNLFEEFQDLYCFLKRNARCFYYNLCFGANNIKEQRIHEENIRRLISGLKGMH